MYKFHTELTHQHPDTEGGEAMSPNPTPIFLRISVWLKVTDEEKTFSFVVRSTVSR